MIDNSAAVMDKPRAVNVDKQYTGVHAIRTNDWKIGNCLHCQNEFQRNTTWQKYCSEACRIAAYELRTGKRIRLKKVGVDSQ